MAHRVSRLSREYVLVPVSATIEGVTIDPTVYPVEVAVVAGSPSSPGSWHTAEWDTDLAAAPDVHMAKLLVGPGGVVAPGPGTYDVWVRVGANPELPVMHSGVLVID